MRGGFTLQLQRVREGLFMGLDEICEVLKGQHYSTGLLALVSELQ